VTRTILLALLLLAPIGPLLAVDAPAPAADAVPQLVENPLGALPRDTPEHETYAHGHYWLFLLWNALG
jgi:hypothetical protein